MTSHFLNVMFTPAVKAAQEKNGSRDAYARRDGAADPDRLTGAEAAFIAARDSFYMARLTSPTRSAPRRQRSSRSATASISPRSPATAGPTSSIAAARRAS
jgi:hypothetical protein